MTRRVEEAIDDDREEMWLDMKLRLGFVKKERKEIEELEVRRVRDCEEENLTPVKVGGDIEETGDPICGCWIRYGVVACTFTLTVERYPNLGSDFSVATCQNTHESRSDLSVR